ncbi:5-(carboxyamino)imidazole ribonucleotide synthase [Oxalobacteraceae bacterium GrIS 2.11]
MKVAVLGNGQLGAMLQQAGQRIGVDVALLDVDADVYPAQDAIVTVEREHWPVNPYTESLQQHRHWMNGNALFTLANRVRQKSLLDQLQVATAAWHAPGTSTTQSELHSLLGPDIFLKSAQGGYDGRGQKRLSSEHLEALPDWSADAIAEQAIRFDREVSIIGARNRAGQMCFYGLTENRHENGVLAISIYQPGRFDHLQEQAERMLSTVMEALDYVGVMAMELFQIGEQLMVNEIAPRVHNSGHWTQIGASIDQFELHLRAMCDLPLAQPQQFGPAVMVNLLGMEFNPAWLAAGAGQFHWYGKDYQPGRKMGHVNFYHSDASRMIPWLEQLPLSPMYQSAIDWARATLALS